MKPTVSVIVIFLNAEQFLQEAVESVLAQTYDNWELLLVDDGSTDASTEIALRYVDRHPGSVRCLEHPEHRNRGMSASRNLGLNHAEGKYVAFLDADDAWLPRKLEQQVAILELHPEAAIVYGATQYWYSWTGEPQDARRDFIAGPVIKADSLVAPTKLFSVLHPIGSGTAPSMSNLMFRREVVDRVGGFEEEFEGLFEDSVFKVKMFLKEPVYVASERWDKYRQHPDSCWAAAERSEINSKDILFLDWVHKYLLEQGIDDPEIWKAFQKRQAFTRTRIYLQQRKWNHMMRWVVVLVQYHPQEFTARLFRRARWTMRKLVEPIRRR